jgi:hypothetical protein
MQINANERKAASQAKYDSWHASNLSILISNQIPGINFRGW